MKKIVKMIMVGLVLLLAVEQAEARSLTIKTQRQYPLPLTVKQINIKGDTEIMPSLTYLFGDKEKKAANIIVNIIPHERKLSYSWPNVTNDEFTLQFQYLLVSPGGEKPPPYNFTAQQGTDDVVVELDYLHGPKRVQ